MFDQGRRAVGRRRSHHPRPRRGPAPGLRSSRLKLRTRRLINVLAAAAATVALSAGSAAADPKGDDGDSSASASRGSDNAQEHRPAGAGTGRRIG
jgi:hypothetical protein